MILALRTKKVASAFRSSRLLCTLLRHGVLAGVEHRPVFLRNPATIVDIGANKGQFALAARHYAPQARVFSFEPLPGPASIFCQVFAGDPMVTLHAVAIGPESGNAMIHVASADDSSSLLPMALQATVFPGSREVGSESIRVCRLADCLASDKIRPPALLKLDVQGYELPALRGCEDLLHHFAWVYAECSFLELYKGQAQAEEVVAWLRERNFFLKTMYNFFCERNGGAVQADFLFEARPQA